GDGERAWSYLEQALAKMPNEPLLLSDLAELAYDLGRWNELADLIAKRAPRASSSARPGLLLELSQALRRAQRESEADEIESALEASAPEALSLLFARERRALTAGSLQKLAGLYRH